MNSFISNFRSIKWPILLTKNKKPGVIRKFFYVLMVSVFLLVLFLLIDLVWGLFVL